MEKRSRSMKKATMKQICLSVLAMVLTFVGILLQG